MRFGLLTSSASALALAMAAASPAAAQDAAPDSLQAQETRASDESEASSASDNVIVVTAQKREQNVQDVPISIAVVGGEQLEDAGIQNIQDLAILVPSFSASYSNPPGAGTSFRIRGIGTAGNNVGLEGAVGFFLDGVYRARSGAALGDLIDIERIEVLKGPQGTLFGKNTSAGAISVITKNPSLYDFGGQVQVDIGERSLRRLRSSFDMPLAEGKIGTRLSIGINDSDGVVTDVNSDRKLNDTSIYNIRSKTLFQPTDDLSFTLIGDYSKSSTDFGVAIRYISGPTQPVIDSLAAQLGLLTVNNPDPDALRTSTNVIPLTETEDWGVSGQFEWDLGGAVLTSITAYRDFQEFQVADIDFTAADILNRPLTLLEVETFTQELRLSGVVDEGLFGGRLDWLVGAFYSDEKIRRRQVFEFGAQAGQYFNLITRGALPVSFNPPGLITDERFRQSGSTYAIFAHGTQELTDRISFTGGLRYSIEDKQGSGSFIFGTPGVLGFVNPFTAQTKDKELSGVASLQVDVAEDVMIYATYSRGFKAGGINLDRAAAGTPTTGLLDPTFNPEFSTNYEAGLKSSFWDNRIVFNVAAFYTEFNDFQLNAFDGLRFTITNVEGATTKGFEVDASVRPADPLFFSAALTYLDATYDDGVGPGGPGLPPLGGQRLAGAPEWSATFVAQFDKDVSDDFAVFANANYNYRTKFFSSTTALPQTLNDDVGILGLRAGIRSIRDNWEVAAYCRNCTNEILQGTGFAAVVQGGSFDAFTSPPGEYGVSLIYRFGR